jgi:CubicO group peptidase (beta-lactamase class C family)
LAVSKIRAVIAVTLAHMLILPFFPRQHETMTEEEPLQVDSHMKKWKVPPSLSFVSGCVERYSFSNWQSGNDDSVYYNLNISSFFKTKLVMPTPPTSTLEHNIKPDLLNLTFFDQSTGADTLPLKEYLCGPKQVQAMMMMHKGKVVFEIFPGMNTNDMHMWMSAAKTSVGLLCVLLWEDGKLDFDKPIGTYVPELVRGTAWENIPVKHIMNMCSGLDIEENFENLVNPNSFISKFFTSAFEEGKGSFREILKTAKPLPGIKSGQVFQYSSTNTMLLVIMIEEITQIPYEQFFKQRVWSKIGAKYPFLIGLAPDHTPMGAGFNVTTPEDFLRYATIFTPMWNVVSKEKIVSDKALKCIQEMGNPACYKGSTERGYGFRWFGEYPEKNTAQWDHAFPDGAMFKHGNMGQGIYVDPKRDFCGVYFGLASNDENITGADKSPGFMRAAAKLLAGE